MLFRSQNRLNSGKPYWAHMIFGNPLTSSSMEVCSLSSMSVTPHCHHSSHLPLLAPTKYMCLVGNLLDLHFYRLLSTFFLPKPRESLKKYLVGAPSKGALAKYLISAPASRCLDFASRNLNHPPQKTSQALSPARSWGKTAVFEDVRGAGTP